MTTGRPIRTVDDLPLVTVPPVHRTPHGKDRNVRTARFGTVAVAGMLALAACSSTGATGTTATTTGPGSVATPDAAQIRLWLNGTDTPKELRDYLTTTFAAQNPGSKLVIEQQDWNGLVPRMQTALASESQTPDLVEIGNTQAPTFTYAGAFSDITGMYDELGGKKLLPGFVAAGFLLSVTLLLRTILYRTGQDMTSYLRIVISLFFCLLLANLFALTGLLALGSALAAGVLLYWHR